MNKTAIIEHMNDNRTRLDFSRYNTTFAVAGIFLIFLSVLV